VLAEGRASEVIDLGDGTVLRRSKHGTDYAREATILEQARAAGLAVPRVHRVEGPEMVLERIDGPTMLDDLVRRPWRLPAHARLLAELHRRVCAVAAPDGILAATLPGDRLVHLDLHPGNVLLSPAGPVIIDWENAKAGDPALDLGITWVILDGSRTDGSRVERAAVAAFRRAFLAVWLRAVDRSAAARGLAEAARLRATDPNVTSAEGARARALAARHGR
jgi:aminoglycoside phosphotransferase (APT) family kinase protein